MVAMVILLRVFAKMSWWRKQVFVILRPGEGLRPSIKITVVTFLVKKSIMKLFGVPIFLEYSTQKNLKSNLVLVVALVFESKGL